MPPEFDWPATPDVSSRVLAQIADRPRRRWPLIALVAAILVPAAGATAVSGDIQRWLGLKGVEVQVGPPPTGVPTPDPGQRAPAGDVERISGFAPVFPPALGTPDDIRARRGVVTLRYGHLRLYELEGAVEDVLLQKTIGAGGDVSRVPGGAYFPRPHFFVFLKPDGAVTEGRTAQSTLLIARGDLLLRLEGRGLSYQRARRLLAP